MIGVSLSRWTMSYFAAAALALVAAETMMMVGYGFPNAMLQAPETLVLVHTVTIGWLSLLICGALFQFVPVLVARPLHSNSQPLPALALLLAGLGGLIAGFLQLAGHVGPAPPFLAVGAVLLGAGFALVVWNLARTLAAVPTLPLSARFVAVGLISIVATAALGIIFAMVLGGTTTCEPLVALTATGLPIHAIAGLGGWLTLTAMGVSYRLLAMFLLSPELERASTKAALYLGAAALTVVVVGGTLAILLHGDLAIVLLIAAAVGLAALGLYGGDVAYLYRARKRRKIELNSTMAALALAALGGSVLLTVVLMALGRLADHVAAVVFLVAFGWLSGLGLAQLYKIVAFLTWLECYGPLLGKMQTPRVQDLVVEARAARWFVLYFLAVGAGTLALLGDYRLAFQASAGAMLAATAGVLSQLVRTRLLADVAGTFPLPQGGRRPHLLISLSHQTS